MKKRKIFFTSTWTLGLGFFPIILSFRDMWINKDDLQVVQDFFIHNFQRTFLQVGKSGDEAQQGDVERATKGKIFN